MGYKKLFNIQGESRICRKHSKCFLRNSDLSCSHTSPLIIKASCTDKQQFRGGCKTVSVITPNDSIDFIKACHQPFTTGKIEDPYKGDTISPSCPFPNVSFNEHLSPFAKLSVLATQEC